MCLRIKVYKPVLQTDLTFNVDESVIKLHCNYF